MNTNLINPYVRHAQFSTLPENHVIADRIIYDYELIFVSGGRCRITFDGVAYTCEKNQAVLIPPGVNHKFEVPPDAPFVQPHIHFDIVYTEKSTETPISFKRRKDMSSHELALITPHILADKNIPYVFTPDSPGAFKRTFFEIINIFQGKGENHELFYKAKMLEIIGMILSQFEGRGLSVGRHGSHVESIKSYIDNNFRQIITLDTLAMQFDMNKFTLLRAFKQFYGVNVIAYYRGKRLDFAKKLLVETPLSVTSVSEQMNFSDIYSFSRFFKMHTGVSPAQFRKNHGK